MERTHRADLVLKVMAAVFGVLFLVGVWFMLRRGLTIYQALTLAFLAVATILSILASTCGQPLGYDISLDWGLWWITLFAMASGTTNAVGLINEKWQSLQAMALGSVEGFLFISYLVALVVLVAIGGYQYVEGAPTTS